jgi:hypothetical protein
MFRGKRAAGSFNHEAAAIAWLQENADDWPPDYSKWKTPQK